MSIIKMETLYDSSNGTRNVKCGLDGGCVHLDHPLLVRPFKIDHIRVLGIELELACNEGEYH